MTLLPSYYLVQIAFAPLPPFIAGALAEIEVETSVEGAAMFRLHFDLSRNLLGDFDALVVDLFRPLIPIRIGLAFGLGLPMTLINGFIRETQLHVGPEPGSSRLEVVGADALGTIMGHIQIPIPWPNIPDSAIAAAIFGKYAVLPLTVPTPPLRTIIDVTTTQHARDNAFLQQLASRYGFQLYIQPDPLIGLDVGHFHPPMVAGPPQGVLSIDFGTQSNLRSLQVGNQMLKPTTIVTAYTDPDTRVPVPVIVAAAAEPPMGLEPSLTRAIPPPIEVDEADDSASPAEKIISALSTVTQAARTVSASGEVDGLKFARPLLAGLPVLIRGAGRQHSGLYLVTSVSHKISREGYTQSFQAMRNAVGLTGAEVFLDPLAPVL